MQKQWDNEKAWAWYNARPWLRGCNYMTSDSVNRIDQWQEYGWEQKVKTLDRELALAASIGFNSIRVILEFPVWNAQQKGFMNRLEQYLTVCAKHGISMMPVLSNECFPHSKKYIPPTFGPMKVDPDCHGGNRFHDLIRNNSEDRDSLFDYPDLLKRYYEFVAEIVSRYARDERVIVWNVMNEPGNGRGSKSLKVMERLFELVRDCDPVQPLCADVWLGMTECKATTEIEQRALELSDVISYHYYGSYENHVELIWQLKKIGRPVLNTEWMQRCGNCGNDIAHLFPFFAMEKIGSYNWGFVAGLYQTYEPPQEIWHSYDEAKDKKDVLNPNYDYTKWFHDLFRSGLHPYDPWEIETIKRFCHFADREFAEAHPELASKFSLYHDFCKDGLDSHQ
jgi:beta-galactosidase/beta-glucuronidase